MRRKEGLIKNYSRLNEADLDYKAQSIVHSLTGNENFPLTDPSLAAFTLVKDNYITARENVVNGGRIEVAIKNQAKQTLLDQMFLLATNIESLAKGDRVKLLTSSFDLIKMPEPTPPITGPLSIFLADGVNVGEIKVTVSVIKGVSSHTFQYTADPQSDNNWVSKSSTTRQVVFGGLPSGTKLYFRAIAIAKKDQELLSEMVSRVVQ